jgi:hypothetical protein
MDDSPPDNDSDSLTPSQVPQSARDLPTLTTQPPVVQALLQQSRGWRGLYFRTMQNLELESIREHGKGRFEMWANENYGEAVKLGPKMMMREPEAAPHGTVEDLIDELDRRGTSAKTIDAQPSGSPSPSGSRSSD